MSEFDNRLIELVRANPCLYERELRSTPYDASKLNKEVWYSIATSLKADASMCMLRWNHLREKRRRELQKPHSNWSLLDKMRFIGQHKHIGGNWRNNEREMQQTVTTSSSHWRALKPEQIIVNEEDAEALQEAMDEQHVAVVTAQPPPPSATATIAATDGNSATSEDLMKRIETLLQGLGTANRTKAEKKIVAYLCKCTLRGLNNEHIDDIFI